MAQGHSERNLAMVDMYAGGGTLSAIGEKFGVTRERVRQILAKQGAVTAEDARRVRREARADELFEAVRRFLDEYREVLTEMAASGVPRTEVEARFRLLIPAVPAAIVREGLSQAGILFDVDVQEFKFSEAVIESAVWFALARELDLAVAPATAVRQLDVAAATELTEVLQAEGLDPDVVANILLSVEAAKAYAAANLGVGLSAQRYNAQRSKILIELGFQSRQGSAPWPPTSQTVMKRLGAGAWADALIGIGLTPDKRGRQRGLLVFNETQYTQAVSGFLDFASRTGQPQSFEMYGKWVDQEERAGRHWPAPASVRLRFGNWMNAKRSAAAVDSESTKGRRLARNAAASEAAIALHQAQSEIDELFGQLATSSAVESRPIIDSFIRTHAQEFEFRRRGWLRAAVEADPTAVSRRLNDVKLPAKQRALLEANPPNISGVLTDMYIDRLANPRDAGGWLRPGAQAELDAIPDETVLRYNVLREIRNFMVHNSSEARERLRSRLDELAEIDPRFELKQHLSSRVLIMWLQGFDARRLRLIVDCVPAIWRAMVVAETIADN